jgi:hypothetical protein
MEKLNGRFAHSVRWLLTDQKLFSVWLSRHGMIGSLTLEVDKGVAKN